MKSFPTYLLAIVLCLAFILSACNKDDNDDDYSNQLTTRVVFKSSSLAIPPNWKGVMDSVPLIPYNITGETMSLLFATKSQVDEGLVVFGDGRPDIAPANTTLYPFDFADTLAVNSSINLKPGFVGGNCEHMVTMFGYIDIFVVIDGVDRRLRLALSDYNIGTSNYTRGDVLLEDTITGDLRFYDLSSSAFTAVRPTNPYVIEEIRDFFDPIRPNMVFYPLNVFLDSNINLDPVALATGSSVDVVVDFDVLNFMLLQNHTSLNNISDSAIINSFEISQNVIGFGNSGLSAEATLTILP